MQHTKKFLRTIFLKYFRRRVWETQHSGVTGSELLSIFSEVWCSSFLQLTRLPNWQRESSSQYQMWPWWMYVIYTRIFVYMYVYIYKSMNIYIYIYIFRWFGTYVYSCVCIYVCIYACIYIISQFSKLTLIIVWRENTDNMQQFGCLLSNTEVYYKLLFQHVSCIILPIIRRTKSAYYCIWCLYSNKEVM